MNHDDIIRLAREVGAGEPESLFGRTDYVVMTRFDLEHFAALVAAHERNRIADESKHIIKRAEARGAASEREACAKVCDEFASVHQTAHIPQMETAADLCAIAIRARSNP